MGKLGATEELIEFSYESTAAPDLPPAVFLRLARQASLRNGRSGLTGELRFDGTRFVQTLEGPCDVVLPLAASILADSRHRDVRVLAFGAAAVRRYQDWSASGFDLAGTEAAFADNLRVLPARLRRRGEPRTAAILSIGATSA
jgi:hypothetical protein